MNFDRSQHTEHAMDDHDESLALAGCPKFEQKN